jgi:hypothetical protein
LILSIEKKFGIGFYYDLSHTFSQQEIDEALLRAEQTIQTQAQQKAEKQKADDIERERLKKEYSFLELNPQNNEKVTKSNLIKLLKMRFPEIKFSVRKEHYGTYNVSWTNAVLAGEIARVGRMFEDHCSSYCGDFRDYEPSLFNKLFGGFKYVFDSFFVLYSKAANGDKAVLQLFDLWSTYDYMSDAIAHKRTESLVQIDSFICLANVLHVYRCLK